MFLLNVVEELMITFANGTEAIDKSLAKTISRMTRLKVLDLTCNIRHAETIERICMMLVERKLSKWT